MPPVQENELKRSLRTAYVDTAVGIRSRRYQIEQQWLRGRRSWMAIHYDKHYVGTDTSPSNYNYPAGRRAIERAATRITKLLTPAVKWFEVAPMSEDVPQDKLSNVDNFMWYILRKKIRSRQNISQLSRCAMLYGLAVQKTAIAIKQHQVWPTQRAVDPFSFYVFPETAATAEDATIVFEDYLKPYDAYNTMAQRGLVDEIPQSEFEAPTWPYHLVERLAYQGIASPNANVDQEIERTKGQLEKGTAKFVSLSDMWIIQDSVPYQMFIAWNLKGGPRIVGMYKSAYEVPLYRWAVMRPLPSEMYTTSPMDDLVELDTIQVDLFNEFMDSVNREQGYLAFGGMQGLDASRKDSFKFKGGAKWDFGSEAPRDVMQFVQPPVTSTNQLRAWQIANGLIQNTSGGTLPEGQPGRNMPRAGGAFNTLVDLAMADMRDIAEIIESEILTPGLSDIYKVASFIPASQLMRIPGGQAFYPGAQGPSSVLKIADVMGDYEYEWVGSLQFQDDAARAQRAMIFMNMIPQLNAELAKQGAQINTSALVQMVWRYSLGERGLDKIVIPMAPPPQAPIPNGMGGMTAPPNGAAPPQGLAGLKPSLPSVTNGFVT